MLGLWKIIIFMDFSIILFMLVIITMFSLFNLQKARNPDNLKVAAELFIAYSWPSVPQIPAFTTNPWLFEDNVILSTNRDQPWCQLSNDQTSLPRPIPETMTIEGINPLLKGSQDINPKLFPLRHQTSYIGGWPYVCPLQKTSVQFWTTYLLPQAGPFFSC